VLAADWMVWQDGGKIGFTIAREALTSKVEDIDILVEDIRPETVGMFDIVLFLGVLYHAQDPLGYLRRTRSVCREMAIIETHVDLLDTPRPALAFYEGDALDEDPTNFFGPNQLAVEAMLREVGFNRIEMVTHYNRCRMVFHAFV
jgi:tRNA (mo5U34)-methyltransferase